MSFYMTLPCDSSRNVFPDNRIGQFTTLLAREVVLENEYEVGLSECVIPVPKRSLNLIQPILYNEKGVTPGLSYFNVDASEINSLTDWQDQYLHLQKTSWERTFFSSRQGIGE